MLINYRTILTLLSGVIFEWLTRSGIIAFAQVNLGGMTITKESIESAIMTLILIVAAIFRVYAGKKLFTKKANG